MPGVHITTIGSFSLAQILVFFFRQCICLYWKGLVQRYTQSYLLLIEPLPDLFAQHVDVGLVYLPAFIDQRNSVVYRNVSQLLLLLLPVFVENEEEFLCPAGGKNRQEAFTPTLYYFVHIFLEFLLPIATTLMQSDPKSTLGNQNVHILLRNLCLHDVPILLTAIISSIENSHPINFDNEHSCPHNMSSHVWGELNPVFDRLDPELNSRYPLHTVLDLLVIEKSLFLLHLSGVSYQVVVDFFGGTSHEHFLFVVVLSQEVRQCSAVVEVGMGNDDHGYF